MSHCVRNVCLFDIDGTLVNAGGAGQAAMLAALQEVLGVEHIDADIPTAGRTDCSITRDLLAHLKGRQPAEQSDSVLAELLQSAYLKHLPDQLIRRPGCVLPGVEQLLEQLSGRRDIHLGLLTGNFREGARLKLEHFGLSEHFRFGAFGDRHLERDDVARQAQRTVACIAPALPGSRLWVIGDTPADIHCGRAIGARVVAVATGRYSWAELAAEQPEFLLNNLADTSRLLQLLEG